MDLHKRIGKAREVWTNADAAVSIRCLWEDSFGKRCREDSTRSHSLQRKGPLAAIAEDGHVYRYGPVGIPSPRHTIPEKVGVKKASVFPGFCAEHDGDLFEEVEQPQGEFTETAILKLAYRSFCFEVFRKNHQRVLFEEMRNDASIDPESQRLVSAVLKGSDLADKDGQRVLKKYHDGLHGGNCRGFKFHLAEFDTVLPFTFTGSFAPQLCIDDTKCYHKDPTKHRWSPVSAFAGSVLGRKIFLLAGFEEFGFHEIGRFISGFQGIPDSDISDYCLSIGLFYLENTFFRISWFDGLGADSKEIIRRSLERNIDGQIPSPGYLVPQFVGQYANVKARDFQY